MANRSKAEVFADAGEESAAASVTRNDYRRFGAHVRLASVVFNVILVLFFCALQIWPLMASYLIGALFHFWIMRFMLQSTREAKGLVLGLWAMVLLQAFFAVWILGAAAGFQFYVMAILPFNFSNARRLLPLKILQVLVIIIFFLACDIWFAAWQPVYVLIPSCINFLRHFNTIGACTMMAGVSYAYALSIQAAEQTLHQLASTDTLTGLLNRRRLGEIAGREQIRSRRLQEPLSVLLCDIDHFKRINDRFGHAAGDHVLQVLANLFLSTLREYDCVSRWGGEEFMVLLPETDQVAAAQIAERLRLAVANAHILFEEQTISVSMTLGVAQVAAHENWHAAVVRADEALYRGKAGGRNQVVRAD